MRVLHSKPKRPQTVNKKGAPKAQQRETFYSKLGVIRIK